MEITEVKVFPVDEGKLKAYVTIILDDSFVIRDLKVISGTSGLFVAMPSKKRKDGSYRDVAHPLNQEIRTYVEETILNSYLAEIKGSSRDDEYDEDDGDPGNGDGNGEAATG